LSEVRQISTFPILVFFWQKDSKEAKIKQGALISHLTQFASPHYRVKCICSKLLHTIVIISIRLLTFALSIRQKVPHDLISVWDYILPWK